MQQSFATWDINHVDQHNLPLQNICVEIGDGLGVTAYIIDTEIQTSHNEFWNNSGEPGIIWRMNTSGDGNESDYNCHGIHIVGPITYKSNNLWP